MPQFDQLQTAFASHLRDPEHVPAPEGLEDRRVQIYRDLLFNNLAGLLAGNFPVIRRLLNADEWTALVRAFYVRHPSHTPLFYEIGSEFVRFLGEHPQLWAQTRPFLHELAHYEWAELALDLSAAELGPATAVTDLDPLEFEVQVSPLAWLLGYRWPVHLIRPEFQPTEPGETPTWLLVYRNRSDQVQFQQLQPLAAQLLQSLQQQPGMTGREAVLQIGTEIGHPEPSALLPPARELLQGWLQRDVVMAVPSSKRN